MPLLPGDRIGLYEILAPLGADGGDEVYRARDARGREVWLRPLPPAIAGDPDRLASFERRVSALTSLQHPNLAPVLACEAQALVGELVDGVSLADLTASGDPFPLEPALGIARQVAAALAEAHERGFVHGRLTPAAIRVRGDGTVKVLDIGVATALGRDRAASVTEWPADAVSCLAPEQTRGEAADRQADVWAFGAILFEMLAGRRAFDGDDAAAVVKAIRGRDPDLTALPAETPPRVRQLIAACLARDTDTRLRSSGDALRELDGQLGNPAPSTRTAAVRSQAPASSPEPVPAPVASPAPAPAAATHVAAPPDLPAGGRTQAPSTGADVRPAFPSGRRVATTAVLALTIGIVGGAFGARALWPAATSSAPAARLQFTETPAGVTRLRVAGAHPAVALTPDGAAMVYQAGDDVDRTLAVRRFDAAGAKVLAGAEHAVGPFVSPDGGQVGFVNASDGRQLEAMPIDGGPARPIARAPGDIYGATWTDDGEVVFGVVDRGLWHVPAEGGDAEALTGPSGAMHLWPWAVPGTSLVLFVEVHGAPRDGGRLAVLDRASGDVTPLDIDGLAPHFVAPSHLVYSDYDGRIFAVEFDPSAPAVAGEPVLVAEAARVAASGAVSFDVAGTGRLVVATDPGPASARELAWVDQDGREAPIAAPRRAYASVAISPDDRLLSLDVRGHDPDVWIWDLQHETMRRRAFSTGGEAFGLWLPDAERLVVAADRALQVRGVDRAASSMPLVLPPVLSFRPTAIAPAGTHVIVEGDVGERGAELFTVPIGGTGLPAPLVSTPNNERNGVVSPDGLWLAYESDASGERRVYVRAYQNAAGAIRQVSTAGGTEPVWSRDGTELFYLSADRQMMRVPVGAAPGFVAGPADVLFDVSPYLTGAPGRSYDVASDARFVMIRDAPAAEVPGASLRIVLNWLRIEVGSTPF